MHGIAVAGNMQQSRADESKAWPETDSLHVSIFDTELWVV